MFDRKTDSVLSRIILVALCIAPIAAPPSVEGAETRMQPSILVSEEYNDNIFLMPTQKVMDYITRVAPSVSYAYKSALWDWDLNYTYDYRYYAYASIRHDATNRIHATQQTRLVDNFFLVEIKDDYDRVSKDISRDFTQESSIVNQTGRNVLSINPYFILRPSSNSTVNTGYTFIDTWYKDPSGINTTEHVAYAELLQEISPKTVIKSGVRYTRDENAVNPFTKEEVYVGPKFEYAEGSNLSFTVGYDWLAFDEGTNTRQFFWDIRGVHKYPTITASFELGLRYIPDPLQIVRREDRYVAAISKDTERTSLTVSAGLFEYRQAERGYLENRNYSVSGTFSHRIAEKTKVAYSLSINRFEDDVANTYTDRYITDVRLERSALENLVWAIEYRYTDAYSHDIYLANYLNSRIILEITKRF